MLLSLYIENYALIEKQTIEFSEGFNVITGETGAGKSIIVGAIAMIMGERASSDLIKTGRQRAILEAVFDIKKKNISGYENEEVLIISRELSVSGRNLIKINGRTVTQSELKNISRYLLDIHGQYQHQLLIDQENHLEILDLFIAPENKQAVALAFAAYAEIRKEHDLLCQSRDMRQEEKDFLKFQLEELNAVNPQPGEYKELLEEKNRLDSYTEIADVFTTVKDSLSIVKDLLHANKAQLASIAVKENSLAELAEQAETLDISFADFKEAVRDYAAKLEYNPQRLDEINERLDSLKTLKRKYIKRQLAEDEDICLLLQTKQQEIKNLLENLEFSDEKLSELEKKLKTVEQNYLTAAKLLSQTRQTAALDLETRIVKALADLKMRSVQFKIEFKTKEYGADGLDSVEYLISPNLGEPLKPLARIVSGGELSRIMLAIKSILLDKDKISSMIFDEIDTGIGGDTANAIAAKIAAIARKHQVICITHLAQIAAVANHHLRVQKNTSAGNTHVTVSMLDAAERQNEIARMLSGKITDNTLAHAQELMRQ